MTRKGRLIFGWVLIIHSYIVAGVGFWLLAHVLTDAYSFGVRFIFHFVIGFSPVFTTLTIINLLKKEK